MIHVTRSVPPCSSHKVCKENDKLQLLLVLLFKLARLSQMPNRRQPEYCERPKLCTRNVGNSTIIICIRQQYSTKRLSSNNTTKKQQSRSIEPLQYTYRFYNKQKVQAPYNTRKPQSRQTYIIINNFSPSHNIYKFYKLPKGAFLDTCPLVFIAVVTKPPFLQTC